MIVKLKKKIRKISEKISKHEKCEKNSRPLKKFGNIPKVAKIWKNFWAEKKFKKNLKILWRNKTRIIAEKPKKFSKNLKKMFKKF